MMFSMRRPSALLSALPSALTTPVETVDWKPKGFPMAITSCPTRKAEESPIVACGSFDPPARTRARSVAGSVPIKSASKLVPSLKVAVRRFAPRTTWSLVRI